MYIQEFVNCVQEECNEKSWSHNVPKEIVKKLFIFCEWKGKGKWYKYFNDESIYIIGLSEDKWDYYWLCINTNLELKFITCCYKIEDVDENMSNQLNSEEKKTILDLVKKYFNDHSNENLIYLKI